MHFAYSMPTEEDKVRVNGRVPRGLYEDISTYYANITNAINDALELLRQEKTGQLHKDCSKNMQNDAGSIQARLDDALQQIEFLKEQIGVKDSLIEKQAYHVQSLIQENSRLNVKLLPENTEVKKAWWKFW
jgi:hypothetical protein